MIQQLREQISVAASGDASPEPDLQFHHGSWIIDLVWNPGDERIAIEGKFKILSDGAVPDNRKAAFFDLFKLEQCVGSGDFTSGMFLWLTDQTEYLRLARGDSADFSTHEGRTYRAGTSLHAQRSRNAMPLPLVLNHDYTFIWEPVGSGEFHSLALCVSSA